MNRAYYEQYRQIELNHWWFQGREQILKSLIKRWIKDRQLSGKLKVLNVGCATGRTSEWLAEFGQVESIEYDEECAQMARQFTGMAIEQGSAEDLQYENGSFDLVTAFDVLEHIPNDRVAAAELMRVCSPGGMVLVSVPAFQWLWSEHDDINQHCRRYRRSEIAGLFQQDEFAGPVIGSSYFNFWLFAPIALIRLAQGFLKRFKPGSKKSAPVSDFQRDGKNFFSPLLRRLFASEARMLASRKLSVPFGVSAYVAWQAATLENTSVR